MLRLSLDPTMPDTSYDPDEVVVPGASVYSFGFCKRIVNAMANAGIRTTQEFLEHVATYGSFDGGRFRSGVGDLGPNATAVALLTMLMWDDAEYYEIEPILDQTGCVVEQGGTLKLQLSPAMQRELNRLVRRFERDPLFGLVSQTG
ncbi:hypothetical protein KBC70_03210 [Candidatus Woesebacteria bacterium]|nr:hypothetical protein [Candidatus Woesebacteria bacterium]